MLLRCALLKPKFMNWASALSRTRSKVVVEIGKRIKIQIYRHRKPQERVNSMAWVLWDDRHVVYNKMRRSLKPIYPREIYKN